MAFFLQSDLNRFELGGNAKVCGDKMDIPILFFKFRDNKGGWRFKTILSNSGIYSVYSIPPPTYDNGWQDFNATHCVLNRGFDASHWFHSNAIKVYHFLF